MDDSMVSASLSKRESNHPWMGNILEAQKDNNNARAMYDVIVQQVKQFQDALDNDHEVGILMTAAGAGSLMIVTYIRYANPSILIFDGIIDGRPAQLIQHMTQLNFLLTSVQKSPERPARRIGFAPQT